jgi:hypothetical protein
MRSMAFFSASRSFFIASKPSRTDSNFSLEGGAHALQEVGAVHALRHGQDLVQGGGAVEHG